MPSSDLNSGAGYRGFQEPGSAGSEFNAQAFAIWSILSRIATATLVQVKAVTNAGGVSPVGFVDILPLVNQVDGAGNAQPHGIIPRCPYFRLQGGANAVILDPQVGDIGIAVFADHDISSATANKAQSNPGSRRRFDMTDAMVVAFWSPHVAINQYVQFSAAGIKLHSPTAIVLEAPDIQLNATTVEINASGAVAITSSSLKHNGVNVGATHVHGGVQTGGGNTAAPH